MHALSSQTMVICSAVLGHLVVKPSVVFLPSSGDEGLRLGSLWLYIRWCSQRQPLVVLLA